jgi:uncharacterized membrane protein YuzA (DUF378 family)
MAEIDVQSFPIVFVGAVNTYELQGVFDFDLKNNT